MTFGKIGDNLSYWNAEQNIVKVMYSNLSCTTFGELYYETLQQQKSRLTCHYQHQSQFKVI